MTTKLNAAEFEAAGYSFEYPGFWNKDVGEFCITISNGMGMNGMMWEVQIMRDGGAEFVNASEQSFAGAAEAIAGAAELLKHAHDDSDSDSDADYRSEQRLRNMENGL